MENLENKEIAELILLVIENKEKAEIREDAQRAFDLKKIENKLIFALKN